MAKKRRNETDFLNKFTYQSIYDKFRLLAMNAFIWEGLPEGIEERFIERELFDHGIAIFFRDPEMSYMCLEAQPSYQLNVYGDPLHYIAYGFNYNKVYSVDDCVIVENNKNRLPTKPWVHFYAQKLTEAERTMDVNVKACKTPIVFACDDKDVLTFKRMYQQVDGNVPAIFADKMLNTEAIKAFDTKAEFLGNELMNYKKSVENELLTFLGYNNIPNEKRERLITDEANSNNQLIKSFFELQLEARERACEKINTMYGLNVSVKPRNSVENSENFVNNLGGVE